MLFNATTFDYYIYPTLVILNEIFAIKESECYVSLLNIFCKVVFFLE